MTWTFTNSYGTKEGRTPLQCEKQEGDAENIFLKFDSQLGKPRRNSTSDKFSDEDPFLASQSLLSNLNNGITMPYITKSNAEDIQHLFKENRNISFIGLADKSLDHEKPGRD
ncbi:hypothetical protein AVEN_183938-1 [Araneus ventricosus]|uniref:Uncharacterized protein n=1 Tax=Araneus ventricosus TaxID=182803 RepID=A0A4Y2E2H0_ARAVE|nr:hypothetical protein AVEN_183938-1 [Araneus ventricosus]